MRWLNHRVFPGAHRYLEGEREGSRDGHLCTLGPVPLLPHLRTRLHSAVYRGLFISEKCFVRDTNAGWTPPVNPWSRCVFLPRHPCAFSAAQALKSLGFIISSDQTTRSEYLCEMSNSAVPRLSHCPSACKPQGQNAMQEKKTSFETVPKTKWTTAKL